MEQKIRRTKKEDPSQDPVVKFAALGGLEEIGRNMMFLEYGNEIVIIDMGLQFPEEETPGIDFIIPNISYLEKRKDNIKGVIFTHAHYDHIGAVPYLMEKLGNPLIFTTRLTKEIVNKRQDEVPNAPHLNYQIIKGGDTVKISDSFTADFFDVTPNIPDTIGIVLKTPVGNFLHPGEYKLDRDGDESKTLDAFKKVAKRLGISDKRIKIYLRIIHNNSSASNLFKKGIAAK